jgi:superfamily II DNA or RNA helicase
VSRSRTSSRRRAKKKNKIPAAGELLHCDLEAWAGQSIARSGRREALLGRVEYLRVAHDGCGLEARVRGNRPLPYRVEIRTDDGQLESRCTCARDGRRACKHAVAAMEALRFPRRVPDATGAVVKPRVRARRRRGEGRVTQPGRGVSGFLVLGGAERMLTREERLAAAREEELASCRIRASRERAKVEWLSRPGEPPRLSVADRRGNTPAVVSLRGAEGELASCTCADFAENELQTCKHTERARRSRVGRQFALPDRMLSIWWQPRAWVECMPDPLREIRIDLPIESFPRSLAEYFDEQGWLKPPPQDSHESAWARSAVQTARRVARRRRWALDLDERVAARIDGVDREQATTSRLAQIDTTSSKWREIVDDLGFRLHPYQELGALFLARRGRAFLADDMGLGKTVQAIVAALLLRHEAGARRALVVCPASLKYQWRREIQTACGEEADVVEGPRAERLRAYADWRGGFLVLNYELVLRDLEAIRAAQPDLVILDEAQRIKNWGTKTAQAVKRLASPHAFILTGTPLENRLNELHSLIEFLHPRWLGPRWRMMPFHAATDAQGRIVAYEGLDVLRRRIRGVFLRRDRRGVLDQLPERTDNTFWIEMTPAQRKPYRKHAGTVAALLSSGRALRAAEVRVLLQSLTHMRILCNAWAQYAWDAFVPRLGDVTPAAPAEIKVLGSPKLEEFARVLEDLLDESDEKIVVFSQWERMLRLAHFTVRELLEQRDLRAEVFHGGLNSRARGRLVEDFVVDPEFRVLFSTDAGGLGLNLQQAASIVVNLEVPWNPAVLEQRIGRVHRMGQRRSVQVLHFVTRGAVEERVRQVVESKKALFDGLLVDEVDRVVLDEERRSSFVRRLCELIDET